MLENVNSVTAHNIHAIETRKRKLYIAKKLRTPIIRDSQRKKVIKRKEMARYKLFTEKSIKKLMLQFYYNLHL